MSGSRRRLKAVALQATGNLGYSVSEGEAAVDESSKAESSGSESSVGSVETGVRIVPAVRGRKKRRPITRSEFLAFVDETGQLAEVVQALMKKAVDGDLAAAKYVVDQRFGGPKTTTVIELGEPEQFEAVVRATARWVGEHGLQELYPLWLTAVRQEIEKLGSESRTSSDEE